MCRKATGWGLRLGVLAVSATLAHAQAPASDWRRIGNSALDLRLPSVASGSVERVWYAPDGSRLYARTASGKVFVTSDFEQWQAVTGAGVPVPPDDPPAISKSMPESSAKLKSAAATPGRLYGAGQNAYRSDDDGETWTNLTEYKGSSLLGSGLTDLAVSPNDPDEVVVASMTGVWRSADGGLSWTGANQFLPNLPAARLVGLPNGLQGVRLALRSQVATEVEWAPGEKTAWQPMDSRDAARDSSQKQALSASIGRTITALASSGDYQYAGDAAGHLYVSADRGNNWASTYGVTDLGSAQAIWLDPKDPHYGIAVLGARPSNATSFQAKPAFVLRTINGGLSWEDMTSNLPETAAAHGVTADRASGAVYVATDSGVYYTRTDLTAAGQPTSWSLISQALPAAAALDVKLDAGGNQLYVALDGYGVYATMAPHRFSDARVVNAADSSARPAAPGSLLNVLGAKVQSARTANGTAPVLSSEASVSQIQVPFDAQGSTLSMTLEAASGAFTVGLPLQSVSPAVFVDPDGAPLILDADSGVLLDASKPAHSNARIQVLATGLGRVKPDWPTGVAAPVDTAPPEVAATVHAYLDRTPVEVTRAVLAPGYVGFYLIEIQLPAIVNNGPAELYIEAEGQQSNRVRLYVEQ
jgi:uncharacterized protein (TIGR03437 family)